MYTAGFSSSQPNKSQSSSALPLVSSSQSRHPSQMSSDLGGIHEDSGIDSSTIPRPTAPGWLMSVIQGLPHRRPPQEFNFTPLEGRVIRRRSLNSSPFGSEPLLGMPRPSPRMRSPRPPTAPEDENAPPTASLMDGFVDQSEVETSDRLGRPPQHRSYLDVPSPLIPISYAVTIFGFGHDQRKTVVKSFLSMSSTAKIDSPEMKTANWVTIIYSEEIEAVRAIRRNGEIIQGTTAIGVRWADEKPIKDQWTNQLMPRISPDPNAPSSTSILAESPTSQITLPGNGRPLILKPSSSAFRKDNRTNADNAGQATDAVLEEGVYRGIKEYQERAASKQQRDKASGVLDWVDRLLFRW